MSAQQKLLRVANKLGLSSLKNMQGSTRVVYDQLTTAAAVHTLFQNASARQFPLTNLGANGNQFQANEALLIEKIGFFIPDADDGQNYIGAGTDATSVKFDLVIGNKTVLKDVVVEVAGQQAFQNGAQASAVLDLEGEGIVIPPQVEFYVVAKGFNVKTRASKSVRLGCYLYGTAALLNFNTTI